jgi:hypothetical protein
MARWTRSCRECRQRRIGCDRSVPACRQCHITNRTCSGPVQDIIIINQTGRFTQPHKKSVVERSQRQCYLPVTQPSSRDFSSIGYVAFFMSFLTPVTKAAQPRPWLYRFEEISQYEKGPVFDVALRAASTAFCGVASGNLTVIQDACRMYSNALVQLSHTIHSSFGVPDIAIFSTTVVLSLFETVWSTSSTAYAAHLRAARKMLGLASSSLADLRMIRDITTYIQYQTVGQYCFL